MTCTEARAAMFMALLPSPMYGQAVDYGALASLFKEPVTTSVTGSPQRVSEVPATMEIITAEDIRRSGAKDIPGVLRHVGGIDTLEWGNDNIDVGVRGYDQAYSSRLLVLVDGREVYADNYGYTPWSSVPVELGAIRQIEVVKGSNSDFSTPIPTPEATALRKHQDRGAIDIDSIIRLSEKMLLGIEVSHSAA